MKVKEKDSQYKVKADEDRDNGIPLTKEEKKKRAEKRRKEAIERQKEFDHYKSLPPRK